MKVWKIRRKSDGMFSTGKTFPLFHKTGKRYEKIGYAKTAFHALMSRLHSNRDNPLLYEIVEFEETEVVMRILSLSETLSENQIAKLDPRDIVRNKNETVSCSA